MESSLSEQESKQKARQYKCPCGKTYLSNAAIFTHIKEKHNGTPPGPIIKPKKQAKRRGRPPIKPQKKNNPKQDPNNTPIQPKAENTSESNKGDQIYHSAFRQISRHLAQISSVQDINPQIWENVDTFKRMQDFISRKPNIENFKYLGVCMGIGLSEFLKEVSELLENSPWQFEQVLILFILLLQYAIDENNSPSIIQEAPIEELIELMNPFIRDHIADYAQYLEIDNLWIMKEINMTKIFVCFYNWLKWKDYTQYCITLI